ncbi:hypothetical protein CEXT_669261 [Caerostris extrusa]|uniref:Uncharacterized protein n=1 Tax=Caerostris extrusa TaxID=172846 RepID=A0AAV4RSR6_CAEEX|nr:hypothetical protein CEXT_669261 [Caerostris extrusa]
MRPTKAPLQKMVKEEIENRFLPGRHVKKNCLPLLKQAFNRTRGSHDAAPSFFNDILAKSKPNLSRHSSREWMGHSLLSAHDESRTDSFRRPVLTRIGMDSHDSDSSDWMMRFVN